MKNKLAALMTTIALGTTIIMSQAVASSSIRATNLNPKVWSEFESGKTSEILVEFRQGDRLPVTFQAQGDFLETSESNPSYVTVKRPFWVNFSKTKITMSLDGSRFQPIQDVVKGMFTIGASDQMPTGVANAINMILKAEIK